MKRVEFIDIARGFGILLVVFGHSNTSTEGFLKTFIYSFHIPLFFVITGILMSFKDYRKGSINEILKKKAKSFLIPYLVLSIINLLINTILPMHFDVNSYLINTIMLTGYGALWFIPCLFFAEVLFVYIIRSFKERISRVNLLVTLILLMCISFFFGTVRLVFARTLIGVVYIAFGYYYHSFLFQFKIKPYQLVLLTITFLLLSTANGFVDLFSLSLNNIILYFFNGVLGSSLLLLLSKRINNNSFLQTIGTNSLAIMALHQSLYIVVYNFMGEENLPVENYKWQVIAFVIVMAIMYGYSRLNGMVKLNNKSKVLLK